MRAERLPSYRGFHYTLRILDKSHVSAKLGQGSLALHPTTMKYIKQALNLPDGMILMSGPTGSGKSTTLIAMIKELFRTRYNIISFENPVEEEVPMVTHVNMENVSHGPLYIRSGMRSDPDILLVGEMQKGNAPQPHPPGLEPATHPKVKRAILLMEQHVGRCAERPGEDTAWR